MSSNKVGGSVWGREYWGNTPTKTEKRIMNTLRKIDRSIVRTPFRTIRRKVNTPL